MSLITAAQLAGLAPHADSKLVSAVVDHADTVLPRYGLATRARLTDFMAHVLVESAYLTTAAENLNYSAERAHAVWPKRFPSIESATPFARNLEALACKVYGGRMGNDTARDGWTYRGQGLLQITGKETYQRLATQLGKTLDEAVALITSAEGMLECAAAVYVMLGAPAHADKGDIVGSTRCINGGENGLADRKAMLTRCLNVWPAAAFRADPTSAAPMATPAPAPASYPTLTRGADNDSVYALQRGLAAAGYPMTADGIFGRGTEAAVRAFQAKRGLPSDGVVGPKTWAALDAARPAA